MGTDEIFDNFQGNFHDLEVAKKVLKVFTDSKRVFFLKTIQSWSESKCKLQRSQKNAQQKKKKNNKLLSKNFIFTKLQASLSSRITI